MNLTIAAGIAEAAIPEPFREEPPVIRDSSEGPLKIKVLVNFAPQASESATMRPEDAIPLLSILRQLNRQPQFGTFSVVAFNLQAQSVVYRQEGDDIDFRALGDALSAVKLGTIDASKLQRKHGDTEFLKDLIREETSADDHPDALIVASPKVLLDASVPEEDLKPFANLAYPVFYVNYAADPLAIPWRDSISRALRVFKGTEFTITKPRDLWSSMTDMVARIVNARRASPAAR